MQGGGKKTEKKNEVQDKDGSEEKGNEDLSNNGMQGHHEENAADVVIESIDWGSQYIMA